MIRSFTVELSRLDYPKDASKLATSPKAASTALYKYNTHYSNFFPHSVKKSFEIFAVHYCGFLQSHR